MKRKKWSEQEEQSLLSKYSEMQSSGALSKLKTREKKFRPVADHVNAAHHSPDPAAFPFRWSWRDVSIKVQNMRHQYLCVKQKIRLSAGGGFNWDDGDNHWENFLAYKSVFGDIDLDSRPPKRPAEEDDDNNTTTNSITDGDSSEEEEEFDEASARRAFRRERAAEGEEEERARWRRREEERREEEEMEWRERMLAMQLHHEKEMLRMQAEAFQSQTQVLGAMVRLLCQFFGGGGADVLGNPVLGNLEHQHHHHNHHHHHHHSGGGGGDGGPELGDNGKPDANSPSGFI